MKIAQPALEHFKAALHALLNSIDSEHTIEDAKRALLDFMNAAFYKNYYISTQNSTNLAIHIGNSAKAGVLIEVKEYDTKEDRYKHLLLLYLQERIERQNNDLQHIISTNTNEWFVFNVRELDRQFYGNAQLTNGYKAWCNSDKSGNISYFYQEIAAPALAVIPAGIVCSYFNLKDYENLLLEKNPEAEIKLETLFKVLSPKYMLREGMDEGEQEMSSPVCYANRKGMREGFED